MSARLVLRRIAVASAVGLCGAAALCAIGLDPTFGQGGKVITPFPGQQSGADAVLVQPDGRIVAAGFVTVGSSRRVALARYNSNGTLDATFGSGGLVVTDAGGFESYGQGLALQADGKILLAGVIVLVPPPADSAFLVIRYLADGSLDPSFGAGGIVITDFMAGPGTQDGATSLSIQADGMIVVAGHAATTGNNTTTYAVARYDSGGGLDPTFGLGGKVVVDMGAELFDSIAGVAVAPNGTIVGCGSTFLFPIIRIGLIRLAPDGNLDPTFGTGGRVYTQGSPEGAGCSGVSLRQDGSIVAFGGILFPPPIFGNFAVLRYLVDGSLDPAFGLGGIALTSFGASASSSAGAVAADGRIVTVGSVFGPVELDWAVAGDRADGQSDDAFGPTGWLTTDFGGHDGARAVAIQPDGRIIAAGFAGPSAEIQFALARYGEATVPVPALSGAGLLALGALLALAGAFVLTRMGRAA